MIVVDTNVLVYALTAGPHSPLAREVYKADPHWHAPELILHEFLNVLATFVHTGTATIEQALSLWARTEDLLAGSIQPVDFPQALRTAVEGDCSAYDAQYVVLARRLGVLLVTEDKRLRQAFPRVAVSMAEFTAA